MESDDKKPKTGAAWMIPYLLMTGVVLGLLSWLVGTTLLPQIPLWGHAVAIISALAILALTLFALGRAGLAGGENHQQDGRPQ